MSAKLLLPSRASAPDHCEDCDGGRDLEGPLCSECVGASFIARVDRRYQNDEGIYYLWSTLVDEKLPHFELVGQFSPLHWGLGVELEHEVASYNWASWWALHLQLGPWSWSFRRVSGRG